MRALFCDQLVRAVCRSDRLQLRPLCVGGPRRLCVGGPRRLFHDRIESCCIIPTLLCLQHYAATGRQPAPAPARHVPNGHCPCPAWRPAASYLTTTTTQRAQVVCMPATRVCAGLGIKGLPAAVHLPIAVRVRMPRHPSTQCFCACNAPWPNCKALGAGLIECLSSVGGGPCMHWS